MAVCFENIVDGAQTHILLIGVGGYPFLNGGSSPVGQQLDVAQLMGQLSSPSISLKAMYDCALRLHDSNSWVRPLGSIDVLVSEPPGLPPAFGALPTEPAKRQNARDAYWRWKAKCDSHEDNVAIFFFCGHGLEKGEQYLIMEDFGQIPGNPWEGAIAFDMTKRAFSTCKANTQVFLVDACRQVTGDMLSNDLPISPIEPPNLFASDCKFSLVQKAAAHNEMAYGRVGEPSFYTKALIKAIEGNAADNETEEDFWTISTGTLSAKMNAFLKAEAASEGYAQRCISTTSDVTAIIRLHQPPKVAFSITCDPTAALAHAMLSLKEMNTEQSEIKDPDGNPWDISVTAGTYVVEANFAQRNFRNDKKYKTVSPPFAKQQLNCQP